MRLTGNEGMVRMQALALHHAYGDSVSVPVLMSQEATAAFPGEQDGGPQVLWTALPYTASLPKAAPLVVLLWDPAQAEVLRCICSQVPSKTPVIVLAKPGASPLPQNQARPVVVIEASGDLRALLYRLFAALLVPALHEGALGMDVADLPFAFEAGGRGHLLEVHGSTFSRASQALLRQVRRLCQHQSFSGLVLHIAAPVGSVRIPSQLDGLLERLYRRTEEGLIIPALTVSNRSTLTMHALVVVRDHTHDA